MIKKIYRTIAAIVLFISLLIIGNQLIIYQFNISSDRLLTEYHELYALQEFKTSIIQYHDYFKESEESGKGFLQKDSVYAYLETTKTNFEENVTPKHLDVRKDSISFHYQNLISYMQQSEAIRVNPEIETSVHVIYSVLNDMIRETQEEIAEAEARNKVIEKHGTYTLLFSGLAFMLIISYLVHDKNY